MFAKSAKEVACVKALQTIAAYMAQVATEPAMSIDDRMKTLQWIYRKIPEINKLLIAIKTENISQ